MTQRRASPPKVSRSSLPRAVFVVCAAVVAIGLATAAFLNRAYADRVSPGVRLGGVAYGGKTIDAARRDLEQRMEAVENEGLILQYGQKSLTLGFTLTDQGGVGLTTDVLSYDHDRTVAAVVGVGHTGSPLRAAFVRLMSALLGTRAHPSLTLDTAALDQALGDVLGPYETPAVEPGYVQGKNGISVTQPKGGKVFDRASIVAVVRARAFALSREAVTISLVDDVPTASQGDGEQLLPAVKKIAALGARKITANGKEVKLASSTTVAWLTPARDKRNLVLAVDAAAVSSYLTNIAPELNIPAKEPKFSLVDGKITALQTSSVGSELDMEAGAKTLAAAVLDGTATIPLPTREVRPQSGTDAAVNLGITELVAVGTTNFAGSPVNRRHNIGVGADLLSGLLIKPGEEFSLIKAIGPVDATKGYRQELVIKGNRTIPEFGGGLCQIGTTMFRLVLNAGLPILERQNHSYRVRYYEPPVGMDATIYEPKPDFRFRNDYAHALLLLTRIEGDNLIFEFWGTKDGRVAATTAPKVSNIVAPPPKLTIETTDLKPGEVKCLEKPHPGSDAEFTYTVTYADGRTQSTVFKSKYRPWREMCLLGVKELKPDTGSSGGGATNANSNKNANKNTNSAANVNSATNGNTNTNANAPSTP